MMSWLRAHHRVVDGLTALAFALVSLSTAASITSSDVNDDLIAPDQPWQWLLVVAPSLCLAFRRTNPLWALAVGTVATMAMWANDLPDFVIVGALLLYSAVVYARPPYGLRAAVLASASLTGFTLLGVSLGEAPAYVLPIVALTVVAATVFGMHTATRQAYIAEMELRTEQAEQHRRLDEQHIVGQERNRIARELHDVVAHGLSVIVVQAGAGRRTLDSDTEGARRSLEQIERTARESLGEMRQVLGALRTEGSEQWEPTPGLSALDALLSGCRASGLLVEIDVSGERHDLPAAVDTGAYRIIQESLTNVLKHGGPNVEASVHVEYRGRELAVAVVDSGRGAARETGETSGHGLRGMQERVDVLGGAFSAGPRAGGGFEVKAVLPLEPARVA